MTERQRIEKRIDDIVKRGKKQGTSQAIIDKETRKKKEKLNGWTDSTNSYSSRSG